MKTKRTLRSLVSSLCCLSMLLAWLPILPTAAAATPIADGNGKWLLFQDNFDSYTVGEDSFFGANNADYTYYASYHGTKSDAADASYALYSIVNTDDGNALEMTSVNGTRGWVVTKHGVSGAHTAQLDVQFVRPEAGHNSQPGLILNPFQGYSFPGNMSIMAYVEPNHVRIIDGATTGSNVIFSLTDSIGSNMTLEYGAWYSIKLSVAEGKCTLKAWEKGSPEPTSGAGVVTVESPAINSTALANANTLRINNWHRNIPGQKYTFRVDNLQIYKTFDSMTVPATTFGVPGETLTLSPTFTGQDLSAELPVPSYRYTLSDPNLGTINDSGNLILGPGEGETKLTLTLTDVKGNLTSASCSTNLVVGSNYGLIPSPAEMKVDESAIGTTEKINITFGKAVTDKYPTPTLKWTTNNESVAKVDEDGTVTFTGCGKATVTAMVTSGGADTPFFVRIPVQVGDAPLRILSIGNSHSRDSFFYLSNLAAAADKRVEAAYLQNDSGTIRHHANNLVTETADYSYYKATPTTGEPVSQSQESTIQAALADGEWDIIMLHQGLQYAGAPGTFNSDLEYVIDYVKAEQPNAKLYWMLGWAYEDDFDETRPTYSHAKNFSTYYQGSQNVMYNAFVDCFEEFIFGADARFKDDFDGWFPTGLAIQNLRATYGDTLTRDGFHLSLTNGRLTAAMAILKTIYPDLDLNEITLSEVTSFLVTNKKDDGETVSSDPNYSNTEANLQLVRDAVNAATANLSKVPAKLPVGTDTKVEDKGTANDLTIAQGTAPIKYFFPDTKTMSDGTIYVSAYKNIYHKPAGEAGSDATNMDEGYGTLVAWYSKDNGKTWSEEFTLVDEDKLLGWYEAAKAAGDTTSWNGINTLRDRYDLLAEDPNANYFVMADPRDPNLAVVNVDGRELLVMTFWITHYSEDVSTTNRCYMMWAEQKDGKLGEWTQPMLLTLDNGLSFVKRGDIAVFPNGRLLIPYYLNGYGGLAMQWDSAKQTFVYLATQDMKGVFPTDETATIDEISFVAPPNSTGTVFAFVRESGAVVKSEDYGMTWTLFGNQDGKIHQPGFQVVDEDRAFVTWAKPNSPRTVYGKMLYFNGTWDNDSSKQIYASPNRWAHDMGDPSSTLMANGKLLVVCYDTEFRSIVGTVVDPDSF